MPEAQITAPTINASIDYSSGLDENGKKLNWGGQVRGYKASEAITEGAAVSFDAPTSSQPLRVHLADAATATDEPLIAGIALEATAAGDICPVTDIGYVALANGGGSTTTAGEGLPLGTDGVMAAGATFAATHTMVALGTDLEDFFGTGLDAVLARVVGPVAGP